MTLKNLYWLNWIGVSISTLGLLMTVLDSEMGYLSKGLLFCVNAFALWVGGKNWHHLVNLMKKEKAE